MYLAPRPTYPFGYGMSYTSCSYSQGRGSREQIGAGGTLRVSFRVTNTGRRAGATVAQLYAVPPRVAGTTLPDQKLAGFKRTRVLGPRRSQRVVISVPLARTLRMWDAQGRRQVVYP